MSDRHQNPTKRTSQTSAEDLAARLAGWQAGRLAWHSVRQRERTGPTSDQRHGLVRNLRLVVVSVVGRQRRPELREG